MRNWLRLSGAAVVLVLFGASGGWAQGAKFKQVTVTGRVVDNICMLGMGLKGDGHRDCAIACDKAGVRMSLLDEKANVLYALMPTSPSWTQTRRSASTSNGSSRSRETSTKRPAARRSWRSWTSRR